MTPQPIRLRDPRKDAYEEGKLAKRIRRQAGEAINDFAMIAEGQRREKPSVYLSPMAQTTSRRPARVSQIQAMRYP